MLRHFTEHPSSVDETYLEHMACAGYFGRRMIVAGLACLLHGVFPFLFTRSGRTTIEELHSAMVENRCAEAQARRKAKATRNAAR